MFVSIGNGNVFIYERDSGKKWRWCCFFNIACDVIGGAWNTNGPTIVTVGSSSMPVSKMLPNGDKLWCGCGNVIKVFNIRSLVTETSFVVNNDSNKHITSIVLFGNGVWLSLQNSAIVKCFHASSFEHLCEINVAPAVTKMLTSKCAVLFFCADQKRILMTTYLYFIRQCTPVSTTLLLLTTV